MCRAIKRDKDGFINRLIRNTESNGECLIWTGAINHKNGGYGTLQFRVPVPRKRGEAGKVITIGAHRLFLMLRLCRPIREGYEAGHFQCHDRLCMVHVEEQTRKQNLELRRTNAKKADNCPF